MGRDGGDKRKKQWHHNGRDGDQKRHKGALASAANAKGHGAVLVTCDRTKERQSVRDALNILNDAADKYFPAASTSEDEAAGVATESGDAVDASAGGDSVQKKLQEEIAQLQTQAKRRQTGRFTPLDTGVKGAVLIQFKDASVSPTALMAKICADVEATKEFSSRFIMRMVPLERVAYSSVEAITEVARPLVKQHLEEYKAEQAAKGAEPAPLEFACDVKRRNCSHLETMDVINGLVEVVGSEHKVNLTTPRSVVLVEVLRNTCGVSVVTNYHRFKKFNLHSIIDPPVSGQQTPAQPKKEDKAATDKPKSEESKTPEAAAKEDKTELKTEKAEEKEAKEVAKKD